MRTEDLTIEEIKLFYEGEELDTDDKLVKDCDIKEGDLIVIFIEK